MKTYKHYFIRCIIFISFITVGNPIYAQTYYNQINFSSTKENVNISFNNGNSFSGIKSTGYANGKVIHIGYFGTLKFPDGGRLITLKLGNSFDVNFNFINGCIYYISPSNELYCYNYKNGQRVSSYRYYSKYKIENNCIEFMVTPDMSGAYDYNSDNYSNGNNSSKVNNKSLFIQCPGCKGNGKCQICKGKTYMSNGYKCSLCHGTGRCQSCAGIGKRAR